MKSVQPTRSAVSTSSGQWHVCMHVLLSTIPSYNTLLGTDIMIKGCSQSCYVQRMNTLTTEVAGLWWTVHGTAVCVCNVRWPMNVSFCMHAPHIWGMGSGIFSPFQLFQTGMNLISIMTAILYKIVISSSQQDSRSKPLQWHDGFLCVCWGFQHPRGK